MACRRLREGSGFTVAPGVVVTNAHVVAGMDETSVLRPDGVRLPAAGLSECWLDLLETSDVEVLDLHAERPCGQVHLF